MDEAALKKERSTLKGSITRAITAIEKIPKEKKNVKDMEAKLQIIPELIEKFQDIHDRLIQQLTEDDDKTDADTYRNQVVYEAENFEQAMHMWIAGESEQDVERDDVIIRPNPDNEDTRAYTKTDTIQEEYQNAVKALEELEEVKRIEQETHRLKLQAQQAHEELQNLKLANEVRRLEEERAGKEERQRLEARLKELKSESVGPTNLVIPPMNTPGRTASQATTIPEEPSLELTENVTPANAKNINMAPAESTPESHSHFRKSRLSWEPSQIAPEQSMMIKTMMTEILNESRVQQQTMVDTLQLPMRKLQTFDGNPLNYWAFIQSFLTSVGKKNVDAASKLSCLLQYCKGQARKILECTEMMPPEYGYQRALEILETRYGDSFEITQRWITKITDRPNIKGPADLRDFADDLQCCQEMVRNMGHLGDLDNTFSMRSIWKKLPQYLQDRWTHRNYEIKKRQKKSKVELKDLVEFVVEAAEEATDPVFSRFSFMDSKGKEISHKTTKQANSCSTTSNPASSSNKTPSGKCPCCEQRHYMTQCERFKAMRIKDRRDFVMKKGLCMNCFAKGHISKDCPRDFTCSVDGCGLKHSKFLHLKPRQPAHDTEAQIQATTSTPAVSNQQISPTAVPFQPSQPVPGSSHFTHSHKGKLAMPIVAARVWNPESGVYKDTYALLDPGSNGTYCASSLQEELGVKGTARSMELTTLTANKMHLNTTVVTLDITSMNNETRYTVKAFVRPDLNVNTSGISTQLDIDKWSHLSDLAIQELDDKNVELLIGQDASDLLVPEEIRRGNNGEPFASLTPLGWAINGPIDADGQCTSSSHFVQTHAPLEEDLRKLWNIEGVNTEEQGMSVNDHKTIEMWNKSLQVIENHYCMDIPFKEKQPHLPTNRIMAEGRLKSLVKRLDKDETLKKKYAQEIHAMIDKGYAEVVPPDDMHRKDGKVWYLPHHPVLNPKKPDKCRVVFDCAARYGGSSLNDHVHQGPDLANKLVGVLLRFRQGAVAFIADVEAMYHQVHVTPKDRDALRFLWFEDDVRLQQLKTLRMKAHLFGGVWSPSCANYALQKAAEEHSHMYSTEVISTVLRNFYVDDCLRSVDTIESAIKVAQQVKELLAKRGFNLTKYISSSPELMKHIPREDWGKALKALDMDLKHPPTERALGMLWKVESDCLAFDTRAEEGPRTKRGVLSTLSTVYDPLGYLSPFVLQARRMFQELCRREKKWDDKLDSDVEESWSRWLEDLQLLSGFSFPRCIKPTAEPIKEAQLHHFSDASQYAYGAASYLRLTMEDDTVHTCLLMAKSRLAPLKGATIPRLELAGALESVRLDKILIEELDIPLTPSVLWVDSQIVLWYLNSSERRFQTYVANRVAKITEHTNPEQWRYIPTENNPGDDASRGLNAKDLMANHRWMHGPSFLQHDEHRWPIQPEFMCSELENQLELKGTTVVYAVAQETDHTSYLLNYFSSWIKLKRAVVWYRRLQQYLQGKKTQFGPVRVGEMREAEVAIMRYTQKDLLKENSQMKKLNPVMGEDGLIKVGGRLVNSHLNDDVKHPVILPYKHHVSNLIIENSHHITGHAGVERVLAETRKRVWIMKGRKLVKRKVHQCIRCKRNYGKTETQKMANLPESRVTPYEPCFTRVGVDYFGPFIVKRGRSELKRYGCVFTCFATRAIHIEIAFTLDTDSFLNALDRFIARRGEPREIWSDNGTNFVGACKELKRAIQEWNQAKISAHLLKREVDWHFNPPAASHMGGVWERQVRTIRKVLVSVISQQVLDDEGLITLLTIVEGIVNNRPLTKLSDDPRDASPLTPNQLLLLRPGPSLPPGMFVDRDRFKRRWKRVQYLADVFWTRWISEYIPRLQERQKWLKPQRNLKAGDLVLVTQSSVPRNQWPLGLVMKSKSGSDGLVRSVEIKTATGTYERPVTKLCLLESVE